MSVNGEVAQWVVIIIAQAGLMILGLSLLVTAMSLCRTLSVLASRLRDTQRRLVNLENERRLEEKRDVQRVAPMSMKMRCARRSYGQT